MIDHLAFKSQLRTTLMSAIYHIIDVVQYINAHAH